MQIKDYRARILMWSALFTATTTLSAMGQTNFPLRLRGSSGITAAYTDGNLIIEFQPGTSPAGNGLQPGQGSWLDRGLRPTEPHLLKQPVSEDQAKAIVGTTTKTIVKSLKRVTTMAKSITIKIITIRIITQGPVAAVLPW